MLLKIYPENPNSRAVNQVVDVLLRGGIIIYPTDTIYGFGCDINNQKAVERIAQIKGLNLKNSNFSFVCHDLSHISDYAKHIDNQTFKMMKKNLPGAFTFVLNASNKVPKLFKSKKKTVGIRVPNNNIAREIVRTLGHPILSSSVHHSDDLLEYLTDPELIYENFGHLVDLVIDGGYGENTASTIVDCTSSNFEIIREGKGELEI